MSITALNFKEIETVTNKGQLYKFLSSAPNVRKLFLGIGEWEAEKVLFLRSLNLENPVLSLLDILGSSHVWKHLHSFYLEFPLIVSKDLMEFLGRHTRTLECLILDSSMLLNNTLRDLLDFVKEQLDITRLEINSPSYFVREHGSIEFRMYDCIEECRMQNYVLSGGEPFLPTARELENGRNMPKYLGHSGDDLEPAEEQGELDEEQGELDEKQGELDEEQGEPGEEQGKR
ncbi:hypothetical protein RUND412_006076 [Rhizina undulata]